MDKNKSIEQLENVYWPELDDYISQTVKDCYAFRKIPLKDLTIRQVCILLRQDIGSEFLMPMVLERMNADLYEEDPEDGSTFLESIDGFKHEMFERSSDLWKPMMAFLRTRREEVEQFIGWKRYEDLIHKMLGR